MQVVKKEENIWKKKKWKENSIKVGKKERGNAIKKEGKMDG